MEITETYCWENTNYSFMESVITGPDIPLEDNRQLMGHIAVKSNKKLGDRNGNYGDILQKTPTHESCTETEITTTVEQIYIYI